MKIFHPKYHVKNVQSIDLEKLRGMGITSLIVDLDETLRKRNSNFIPPESIKWVKDTVNKGFSICISSNNPFLWLNRKIEETFDVPCSFLALKPFPLAFTHAMRMLKSDISNTASVGDQLFTDILGANMMGIYSILVDPITGTEKGILRRVMRWLEQKIFPRVNLEL